MVAITSIDLVSATSIPDQIYKVADPAIVLLVPQYTQIPAIATVKYAYTLIAPTPSFVTLLGAVD